MAGLPKQQYLAEAEGHKFVYQARVEEWEEGGGLLAEARGHTKELFRYRIMSDSAELL